MAPVITSDIARVPLADGALEVAIHDVSVPTAEGAVPCWGFVTHGLVALDHREILFVLRRRSDEVVDDFPQMVVELLQLIHGYAAQGQRVDEGGFTGFGDTGFLGTALFQGLGYVRGHPLGGISPPRALSAIALMGDEAVVAQRHGLARVAARLGLAASHFPVPYWSDRDRAPVMSAKEMGQSLLERVARLYVLGARVVKQGLAVCLSIGAGGRSTLAQALSGFPADLALAVLTQPHADADSLLVWRPGQRGPLAISEPGAVGERTAGAHCTFVPQQSADGMQVFEDGFALMITDETWIAIRGALTTGGELDVPFAAGGVFQLRSLP